MKKITLLLTLAFAYGANSQDNNGLGLGLRFGLGLNSASVDPGTAPDGNMTIMNAAFIAEKGISDLFAIQGELALSDKGGKQTYSGVTVTSSFKYLGLNILPKVRFGADQIEGFLMAGPGINLKMSATSSSGGASADIPNVSGLDLTGIIGGGAAYKLSSGKVFLDARYNMGLMDVSNESPSVQTVKLNQIGINLGYIHNF